MVLDAGSKVIEHRRQKVMRDMAFVAAVPWFVFLFITILFLFMYMDLGWLVWTLVGITAAGWVGFLGLGLLARNKVLIVIGFLSLLSVVASTVLGIYLCSAHLAYYHEIRGSETDVDPLAAAPLGVNVFRFANRTFVDGYRTIGFVADRHIFCVAPVAKEAAWDAPVMYWAAGRDCCSPRGDFRCGSLADPRLVDKSTTAVTAQYMRYYDDAVKMATGIYGMGVPPGRPRFVEFTADTAAFQRGIWDDALTLALATSAIVLVGSAVCSALLGRSMLGGKDASLLAPAKSGMPLA